MTSNSNTASNAVTLLVGDPVDDPGEHRFLARLIPDLAAAGVDAVVYANFITPGRLQRQVDLLVWTPHRVLQVEIKVLDERFPVRGHVNGHWMQVLPDGAERSLGKNGFRQALTGTYAVSDRLAGLAPTGGRKPAKDIDTIVCVYPDIPKGSTFDPVDHVSVVGYPALLARIAAPAAAQPWDRGLWNRLAMDLHLYDPSEDDEGHAARAELADYGRRAAAAWSSDLASRVDIGAQLGNEAVGEAELERRARSGHGLLLHGPSGYGKSFLARHLAARMSGAGDMVVWLRADEYERGQLRRLLAKGAAPYSSSPVMSLVRAAALTGAGPVLIVDGLNECPGEDQAQLLEQLAAFRLRFPCGVVITSTINHPLPAGLAGIAAALLPPNDVQRIAVLEAHGAAAPYLASGAFSTPHDLALAARCSTELGPDATVAALHDAYVRTVAPKESNRAALREVAKFLHRRHRSAAPVLDVAAHLRGAAGAGLAPAVVDNVLANPLLDASGGRVRFKHDLLRDFLVSEHILANASTPADLADALRVPANRGIVRQTIELERDPDPAVDVLDLLADRDLYVSALTGEFGPAVRDRVDRTARMLLAEAASATSPGGAVLDTGEGGIHGRWVMSRSWPPSAARLLDAVGVVLDIDHLDLIGEILDRTDDLIQASLTTPDEPEGVTVSHAVAAAYALQGDVRVDCIPAAFVVANCEWRRTIRGTRPTAAAAALLGPKNPGWGRCWIAAQTVDEDTAGDLLPELVRHALRLGGYHLILHTLWAVSRNAGALDPSQRDAVLAALDGYYPRHLGLSSALVEALAALGAIQPVNTLDAIRQQIDAVLDAPDEPDAPAIAAGIVGSQFEDESIVGPFCEAIDSLDPLDRLRLILLATHHPDRCLSAGWRVRQVAGAVPTGDQGLDAEALDRLSELSRPPTTGGFMPQEDIEVHLYAVEGLARLGGQLTAIDAELSDDHQAWHQIACVLLNLHGGDHCDEAAWDTMLETLLASLPDVLWRMRTSQMSAHFAGERRAYELVVEAYPHQVRRALHWALEHLEELTSLWPRWHGDDLANGVIVMLGAVGDQSTITRLEPLATDQRLGRDAVAALRAIHERLATTPATQTGIRLQFARWLTARGRRGQGEGRLIQAVRWAACIEASAPSRSVCPVLQRHMGRRRGRVEVVTVGDAVPSAVWGGDPVRSAHGG